MYNSPKEPVSPAKGKLDSKSIIFSLVFIALFAVIVAGISALSDDAAAAVNDEFEMDDIKYRITSEDPYKVTVIGGSSDAITSADIPDSVTKDGETYAVTEIGPSAFYNYAQLASASIPDSVTAIGSSAFAGCSALASVTLSNNISIIQAQTFASCTSLGTITIPGSVTTINNWAFYNCTGLSTVVICGSSSVISAGGEILDGCSNLGKIFVPKSIANSYKTANYWENYEEKIVGYEGIDGGIYWTFVNSNITIGKFSTGEMRTYAPADPAPWSNKNIWDATILSGVTNISDYAFYNKRSMGLITIPDSVTSIGENAFSGCTNLDSVTIPGSVASIGNDAFHGCSYLISVKIQRDTSMITGGSGVFDGCSRLNRILLPSNLVDDYKDDANWGTYAPKMIGYNVDGGVYWYISDGTLTIGSYTTGAMPYHDDSGNPAPWLSEPFTTATILSGVTNVGQYAFYGCSGLTSVTIPGSVTYIGSNAFEGCTGLTSATIPSGVTSINTRAFYGCTGMTSVAIPDGTTVIGISSFEGCTHLTNVTVPGGITSFGSNAFKGCTGLTEITLSDGLTNISAGAFYGCTGLTLVTIPGSVTSIGSNAFYGCTGLTTATIQGNSNTITGGSGMFDNCTRLDRIFIPHNLVGSYLTADIWRDYSEEFVGYYGIEGGVYWSVSDGTLTIGKYTTGIMNTYRRNVPGPWSSETFTTVVIEDGVTHTGDCAFYGITTLTSVTILGRVSNIGHYLFYGCTGLVSVTIPDSVTVFGEYSFGECRALTSVTAPSSVSNINRRAFSGCTGLTSVVILNDSGTITGGSNMFDNCTSLENILVPSSLAGSYRTAEAWRDYSGKIAGYDGLEGGIYWSVSDGILTIGKSTTGMMNAYTSISPGPWCSGTFTSAVIGNGVANIGDCAFYGCTGLTSVVILNDSGTITGGSNMFNNCTSLEKILVPSSLAGSYRAADKWTDYSGKIVGYDGLEGGIYWSVSDGIITIGKSTTGEMNAHSRENIAPWKSERFTSAVIGDGVTNIGDYAFYEKGTLSSVTISETVGRIGSGAFSDCTALASVTIPDSVISIGERAFSSCRSITSITIPDSVLSFGNYTFYACSELTYMVICNDSAVISSGTDIFNSCNKIVGIYVPSNLVNSYKTAYQWDAYSAKIFDYEVNGGIWWHFESYAVTIGKYDTGIMPDYSTPGNRAPWYVHQINSVTVLKGVTNIGNEAFYGKDRMTSVAISDTVASIGANAFNGCTALASVTIPGSVTSIGDRSFSNCTSLTSLTIPGSVTSIGSSAFSSCTGLTSVTLSPGLTAIGGSAFSRCSGLTSVTIPGSVTSIGNSAFTDCTGLTSIDLCEGIAVIGNNAFYMCTGLTSVTIPGSVTSMGQSIFFRCSSLTTVVLSEGITAINDYAFNFRSDDTTCLASVIIPDSVTYIGNGAFIGCTRMTSIIIPDNVTSIGESAFEECTGLTSVIIPYNVTSLGRFAFYNCSALTSAVVQYDGVVTGGSDMFTGCSQLELIVVPATYADAYRAAEHWSAYSGKIVGYGIDGGVFWYIYNDVLTVGKYTTSIIPDHGYPDNRSPWCSESFTSVTVLSNVTRVGDYAFFFCGFTEVTIQNGVTSIGESAFESNQYTTLTIPDSVTYVGPDAFSNCSYLTSVTIPDSITALSDGMFSLCTRLTSVTIPNSVTSIGRGAFEQSGLTSVTIPDSVTILDYYAFYGCANLTSVTIPDSVRTIGQNAFSNCTRLTSVTIPNSVTSIDTGVFMDCTGLTSVTIPNSVTSIGYVAFAGCTGLTSLTIPSSVTSLNFEVFRGCSRLSAIVIPDSITSIGNGAFKNCEGLTSVTLGSGVTSISNSAFLGCTGLTTVTLPINVSSIGESSFEGCTSLDSIVISKADTVSTGNASMFNGCTALRLILVPTGLVDSYTAAEIWSALGEKIAGYDGLDGGVYWSVSGGALSIGKYTTGQMNAYSSGSPAPWNGRSFSSASILNGVTNVGNCAFLDNLTVTSITIADSVTTIADSAFRECSVLASVAIPNSVTSIGDSAFRGSIKLRSLTIPDSVISIGAHLSENCYLLSSVTFGSGITAIPEMAFVGCSVLESITIPSNITSIGEKAFSGCSSLTSVTIPGNVTSIGDNAFQSCTGITLMTFVKGGNLSVNDIGLTVDDRYGDPAVPQRNHIYKGGAGTLTELHVTLDGQGGTPATIKAATNAMGQIVLPAGPSCPPHTFVWWNHSADGTGAVVEWDDVYDDFTTVYAIYTQSITGGIQEIAAVTYNGNAQEPVPVAAGEPGAAYWGGLTLGTDYVIAYANNVNAGTATVNITGIGLYDGTISAPFTISKRMLGYTGTLAAEGRAYDGTTDVTKASDVSLDKTNVITEAERNNIDLIIGTIALDSPNAGIRHIVAGGYMLTGSAAANYDIAQPAAADVTITEAASVWSSAPAAIANLFYTGTAQNLITAGTTSDGTAKYSLDGTSYSEAIPTGTEAMTYTVYCKIFGDSNHLDSADTLVNVTIANICTVAFDANGHGTAPQTQNVASGQKASRPANPSADGFNFFGWYREAGCTTAYDFDSIVTANLTLYAKWEAVENKPAEKDKATDVVIDIDVSKFQKVIVDGVELEMGRDYTVNASGNIDIRFTEEFMKTLSLGEHQVLVCTSEGNMNSIVTVKEPEKQSSPNVVLIAAGAGGAAVVAIGAVLFIRARGPGKL